MNVSEILREAHELRMRDRSMMELGARIYELEIKRELARAEANGERARQIAGRSAELRSRSSSPS